MTLSELLVELKEVDPKLYDDISHLELIGWQQPRNQAMDHLQGCIQRACERRGWTWRVFRQTPDNEKSHGGEIGEIAPGYEGDCYEQYHEYCIVSVEGDFPAEALLAAYIAAVRAEEMR